MDRRTLLLGSAGALAAALVPRAARGDMGCMPLSQFVQRCEVGIDSGMAGVSAVQQNNSQWCWAACIESVFRYYGHPVAQQRIVAETWGDVYNLPADPYTILANLNRPWRDEFGAGFSVLGDVLTANVVTASQDLAGGMPLIIGTHGHAMVLTAMAFDTDMYGNQQIVSATVRDPWMNRGRRFLSGQEWMDTSFLVRIRVL